MQVLGTSMLQRYHQSSIGGFLRRKIINKVYPESQTSLLPAQSPVRQNQILENNRFSFCKSLLESAKKSSEQVVFVSKGINYTASNVLSDVKRVANGLKRLGVKEGDKVAIMALPHERELFESFFATQAIGAVPVLINFLNPPETIAYMFANSGAKTLIVGRDYRLRLGANKLALAGLLENVVTIGKTDYSDRNPNINLGNKLKSILDLTSYNPFFYTYEYLSTCPELKEEELVINPFKNAPALQLFTSGTSKQPRIMTYTYEMIAHTVDSTSNRFDFKDSDRWLLPVPFYHLAGLVIFLGAINYRNPLVLTEIPRYSRPSTLSKAIDNLVNKKVTIFPGVPRVIEPVLEEAIKRKELLPDLRLIFSGGAPMTPKLVELIDEINKKRAIEKITPLNMINFYASTECGPISSTVKPITKETIDSLGLPFDLVEVKLSDDGDNELLIRAPEFPPEITPEQLTKDGFFKTGDQVEIDNDRSLIYKDRLSDSLNVRGEKISPLIIQRELEKVPGIKEAHVFGVTKPNDKTDMVCAVVIPVKEQVLKQPDIKKYLLTNLSPGLVAFVPTVIFIEPDGIPDALIRGPGKTPRRLFKKLYGERALKEYFGEKQYQGMVQGK